MTPTTLSLPLRLAARASASKQTWVCTRCMATQTASSNATSSLSCDNTQFEAMKRPSLQPVSPPAKWVNKWIVQTLPHPVPIQYLQHTTSTILSEEEQECRQKIPPHKPLVGVVVSAGKMHKTVKVRIPGQRWEKKIGKFFSQPTNHLVHDPRSSLIEGDVVSLHRLRVSSAVHHVVASIVNPFGKPREERPPIPTPEERLAEYKFERLRKLQMRARRRKSERAAASEAAETLQSMEPPSVQSAKQEQSAESAGASTESSEQDSSTQGVLNSVVETIKEPIKPAVAQA